MAAIREKSLSCLEPMPTRQYYPRCSEARAPGDAGCSASGAAGGADHREGTRHIHTNRTSRNTGSKEPEHLNRGERPAESPDQRVVDARRTLGSTYQLWPRAQLVMPKSHRVGVRIEFLIAVAPDIQKQSPQCIPHEANTSISV